jgi:uncharacterized protein (TIGR02147 family)
MKKKPNIYMFLSGASYLNAVYLWKKKTEKLSLDKLSEALNLKSKSHLHGVLNKNKTLSISLREQFSEYLGHNRTKAEYLRLIVGLDQCKKKDEEHQIFRALSKILYTQKGATCFAPDGYEYLSKWYYPALKELVQILPNASHKELGEKIFPPLRRKQVQMGLATLTRLGIAEGEEHTPLKINGKNIHTGEETASSAVYQYQKKVMSLGIDALIDIPKEERDISTITMNLNPERLPELKKMFENFRKQVVEFAGTEIKSNDEIYQLNLQLFPVSQVNKKNTSVREESEEELDD